MALHMTHEMAEHWKLLMKDNWTMYPTPLVFMKHGGFVNLRGRKSQSDVFPGMVSNCDFWFLWKRAETSKDYVPPKWTFESTRAELSLGTKGVAGLALNGCANLSLRVHFSECMRAVIL